MNRTLMMIFHRFLNVAINKGVNAAAHRGTKPGDVAQQKAAKAQAKRARQAIRVTRKIGRF